MQSRLIDHRIDQLAEPDDDRVLRLLHEERGGIDQHQRDDRNDDAYAYGAVHQFVPVLEAALPAGGSTGVADDCGTGCATPFCCFNS